MQRKFTLEERNIPTSYYNILADLPTPMDPPLHPGSKQPVGPQDLMSIFPMELIKQEASLERFVEIPDAVRNAYTLYRPTPVFRALQLERALDTPAHLYYKFEGVSPSGSHKMNTALAQVYYNKEAGIKRLATETGAGQWGSSLSFACQMFNLQCKVYQIRFSYDQKPYCRSMMQAWGSELVASPSRDTKVGREILEKYPDSTGSLGIAISEAVEDASSRDDTNYALGSVLNHVLLHQTVIGLEAKKQMELAGEYPDVVIGCAGGGSNFGGMALPFMKDKIDGKKLRAIAVEPSTCPTLTKGEYRYDFGDVAGTTPLLPMYTLGNQFVPPAIYAGGLRYHGMSPIISKLYLDGMIEAQAYEQVDVFEAATLFARAEGIIPAPESSHAIKSALEEAKLARLEGSKKVILFNISGHGHFDMAAYDAFLAGKLDNGIR